MKSHLKTARVASGLLMLSSLVACAELTHLTRERPNFDKRQVVTYVDAKQRIVASSLRKVRAPENAHEYDEEGNLKKLKYIDEVAICAEPSPDALSAIAASQGLSLTNNNVEAALNSAFSEGASSIGLRTQSIQLMRDAMYRLCEAHLSGAVGDLAFETMHRRFQSSMVAILAIEQLTGAITPQQTALSGEASVTSAEQIAKLTDKSIAAQKELDEANAAVKAAKDGSLADAQKAYDDGVAALAKATTGPPKREPTDEEKKQIETLEASVKAEQSKVKSLEEEAKKRSDAVKQIEKLRTKLLAGDLSVSTDAEFSGSGGQSKTKKDIENVASRVAQIVKEALNLSFENELCTTVLIAKADGELRESPNGRLQKRSIPNNALEKLKRIRQQYKNQSKRLSNLSRRERTISDEYRATFRQISDKRSEIENARESGDSSLTTNLESELEDLLENRESLRQANIEQREITRIARQELEFIQQDLDDQRAIIKSGNADVPLNCSSLLQTSINKAEAEIEALKQKTDAEIEAILVDAELRSDLVNSVLEKDNLSAQMLDELEDVLNALNNSDAKEDDHHDENDIPPLPELTGGAP